MDAKRDWGFAPEYVEAMWMIMQHDKPEDFVCATGEAHSVKEFVDEAFSHVNLNPADFVKTNEMFMRPKDVNLLQGDPTKLKETLGWKPKVTFKELVGIMVKADIERWEKFQKGEMFPWDAPNYPDDMDVIKRHIRKK